MGFTVRGQCYETAGEAGSAMVGYFPTFEPGGYTYVNGVPSVSESGVMALNVSIYNRQYGLFTVNRTYQLPLCTYESAGPELPYNVDNGAAFWAFGFTSLLVLYLASHAMGLVIKAVKRF